MMQSSNMNIKIFIFSGESDYEKNVKIRDFLKELRILHIIVVNIDFLFNELTRSGDIVFSGFNVIEKNPYMLPIIFYGDNKDNTAILKEYFGSSNRIDMGWIIDMFNRKEILGAVGEIRIRFAL